MRFLLVLLVACGGVAPGGGTEACETEYPPPAELDAAYTVCEVDDDCRVVELGVCDACNGGTAVAVNGASEGTVFDLYAQCEPDEEWGCTEMACAALIPLCEAGSCVMEEGEF
jgi:hypothetical protein